jgi:hypothetical protein
MIEHLRHGQSLIEPVVQAAGIYEDSLGLDPHFLEQGEQQSGLGLAIAKAALPGFVRRSGREIAAVEPDIDVADILLNQLKGGSSPAERGRLRDDNAARLFLER